MSELEESMVSYLSAIDSLSDELRYIIGISKKDKKFVKKVAEDILKGKLEYGKDYG